MVLVQNFLKINVHAVRLLEAVRLLGTQEYSFHVDIFRPVFMSFLGNISRVTLDF